jgi:hypothetical protein
LTKARHDPETQAFLERKQAEGKTRREARRALKRHLVRRVYGLLQPPAGDAPGRPPIIAPAGTTIACNTPSGRFNLT